jgi:uncharacterized protein YndB with AHSA1/START domain
MMKISTHLQCSPDEAFRSWTDANEIVRWWGNPALYRLVTWKADLAEGGVWRARFQTTQGAEFGAEGTYLAISPPSTLEWTWRADWNPDVTTLLRMGFAANESGTVLTLCCDGFPSPAAEEEAERGWREIVGWLQDYHASEPHGLD